MGVSQPTPGSWQAMSTAPATRRRLAPLAVVTAGALVFALLLVLVRLRWAPLESADHGAATQVNSLIAGNAALVTIVKAVTWLGSSGVLWTLIAAAVIVLAIRRRWRLASYLLVTGAGGGRPRPRPGFEVGGPPISSCEHSGPPISYVAGAVVLD